MYLLLTPVEPRIRPRQQHCGVGPPQFRSHLASEEEDEEGVPLPSGGAKRENANRAAAAAACVAAACAAAACAAASDDAETGKTCRNPSPGCTAAAADALDATAAWAAAAAAAVAAVAPERGSFASAHVLLSCPAVGASLYLLWQGQPRRYPYLSPENQECHLERGRGSAHPAPHP